MIIGHEHPSVKIRDPLSGGMKMACFLHMEKEGIIVLPPFSLLSSGTDLVLSDPESFMSPACRGADTDSAKVYGVSDMGRSPWEALGDIRPGVMKNNGVKDTFKYGPIERANVWYVDI